MEFYSYSFLFYLFNLIEFLFSVVFVIVAVSEKERSEWGAWNQSASVVWLGVKNTQWGLSDTC